MKSVIHVDDVTSIDDEGHPMPISWQPSINATGPTNVTCLDFLVQRLWTPDGRQPYCTYTQPNKNDHRMSV